MFGRPCPAFPIGEYPHPERRVLELTMISQAVRGGGFGRLRVAHDHFRKKERPVPVLLVREEREESEAGPRLALTLLEISMGRRIMTAFHRNCRNIVGWRHLERSCFVGETAEPSLSPTDHTSRKAMHRYRPTYRSSPRHPFRLIPSSPAVLRSTTGRTTPSASAPSSSQDEAVLAGRECSPPALPAERLVVV